MTILILALVQLAVAVSLQGLIGLPWIAEAFAQLPVGVDFAHMAASPSPTAMVLAEL